MGGKGAHGKNAATPAPTTDEAAGASLAELTAHSDVDFEGEADEDDDQESDAAPNQGKRKRNRNRKRKGKKAKAKGKGKGAHGKAAATPAPTTDEAAGASLAELTAHSYVDFEGEADE